MISNLSVGDNEFLNSFCHWKFNWITKNGFETKKLVEYFTLGPMAHVTLVEIECEGNLKTWCDGPC